MKTRISMLAVAAVSMLSFMTSCDSESLELGSDSVMLEAEVSSVAKVRSAVEGTTLPAGSNYGLYVFEDYRIVADNIKMSTNSTSTGYQLQNGHSVCVGAYYPYIEKAVEFEDIVDIYPGSTDYLHTISSGTYTKSYPNASIQLYHALARVKFNVGVASGVTDSYKVSLKSLDNIYTKGGMRLGVIGNEVSGHSNGLLKLDNPINGEIKTGTTLFTEVFLLPQSISYNGQTPKVTMDIDGETIDISQDIVKATTSGQWESGKVYTYNITISEGAKYSIEAATIEEWGEAEELEGATAEEYVIDANGHEYVDLGLPSGTLWATCNIGASSPEEYGDYYAWGETETKNDYSWSTYKWCNGTENTLTKYISNSSYGSVDNKWELDLEDDVAHVKWGGKWRMPTNGEMIEFKSNCTWTWTILNGVYGYKVVGKNGNSIFLPAAGCRVGFDLNHAGEFGFYWSSTLGSTQPTFSNNLYFDLSNKSTGISLRYAGRSIRPVIRK